MVLMCVCVCVCVCHHMHAASFRVRVYFKGRLTFEILFCRPNGRTTEPPLQPYAHCFVLQLGVLLQY